jgi:2-oxoglutarate dehydrogenase E1 component
MDLIARKTSASPATGYHKVHVQEQNAIIEKALKISK